MPRDRDQCSDRHARTRRTARAAPSTHEIGKAKPIQNTASTGSRAIARTPPTLDPFHPTHAAPATASATMRNAIKSHTKVRWLTREDQGPPYISKGPKNVGRVPRRERQTATGIVEIPNPAA